MSLLKSFIWSFCLSFFCLSLMIMTTVLWVTPYYPISETPTYSYVSLPTSADQLDLLIIQKDQALTLLSIQPQHGKILFDILPISSNINGTLISNLSQNKEYDAIIDLLSVYYSIQIEKLIILDNNNLKNIINLLDGIHLHLDASLSYSMSDIEIILEKGTQQLNGEQTLFFLNQAQDESEYIRRYENILTTSLMKILSRLSAGDFQPFYEKLLDQMDSDLSLNDYDRYYSSTKFLAQLVENPIHKR